MSKKFVDPKREVLSALIDGEASELELHRLVREFRLDESLVSSCVRYQDSGSILRGSNNALSEEDHRHLFARITEAVENEEIYSEGTKKRWSQKNLVLGGLGMAASFIIALFIGVQQENQHNAEKEAGFQTTQNDKIRGESLSIDAQVSTIYEEDQGRSSELLELDEDKQRRLRAYLNQHDQMSRMTSGKRFVNYKETQKK